MRDAIQFVVLTGGVDHAAFNAQFRTLNALRALIARSVDSRLPPPKERTGGRIYLQRRIFTRVSLFAE